jgi:hypothetical protein
VAEPACRSAGKAEPCSFEDEPPAQPRGLFVSYRNAAQFGSRNNAPVPALDSYAMNPEPRRLFLRCTADGKRFLITTYSEASEGESAPVTAALKWAARLWLQALWWLQALAYRFYWSGRAV